MELTKRVFRDEGKIALVSIIEFRSSIILNSSFLSFLLSVFLILSLNLVNHVKGWWFRLKDMTMTMKTSSYTFFVFN